MTKTTTKRGAVSGSVLKRMNSVLKSLKRPVEPETADLTFFSSQDSDSKIRRKIGVFSESRFFLRLDLLRSRSAKTLTGHLEPAGEMETRLEYHWKLETARPECAFDLKPAALDPDREWLYLGLTANGSDQGFGVIVSAGLLSQAFAYLEFDRILINGSSSPLLLLKNGETAGYLINGPPGYYDPRTIPDFTGWTKLEVFPA